MDQFRNLRSGIAIPHLLSSILHPLAEGERFELSQAEARRFSGPVHCQLCEPSAKREQEELNLHQRFWRPQCCRLHHAPRTYAEGGNRTPSDHLGPLIYSQMQSHSATSASSAVSALSALRLRPAPQTFRLVRLFCYQTTKKERSVLRSQHRSSPLLKSLRNQL